jgi:hypothetical protein
MLLGDTASKQPSDGAKNRTSAFPKSTHARRQAVAVGAGAGCGRLLAVDLERPAQPAEMTNASVSLVGADAPIRGKAQPGAAPSERSPSASSLPAGQLTPSRSAMAALAAKEASRSPAGDGCSWAGASARPRVRSVRATPRSERPTSGAAPAKAQVGARWDPLAARRARISRNAQAGGASLVVLALHARAYARIGNHRHS